MKTKKTIIILVLVIVALIALSRIKLSKPQNQQSTENNSASASATSTPLAAGSFRISTNLVDLGHMKVSDERTATFTVINTSNAPVAFTHFETSCDCTFGQVTIGSSTSPQFNMRMHMPPADFAWRGVLQPGQQGTIAIMYKPTIMPVYGEVERLLRFETSDPSQGTVELKIHAFVE